MSVALTPQRCVELRTCVGLVLHVAANRSDIQNSARMLARTMQKPSDLNLKQAARRARYLRGSRDCADPDGWRLPGRCGHGHVRRRKHRKFGLVATHGVGVGKTRRAQEETRKARSAGAPLVTSARGGGARNETD